MAWTGEEMIVWGGCTDDYCETSFYDGAAYNPDTDEWRLIADSPLTGRKYHMAVWSGSEMLVIGGRQGNRDAAAYSPDTDTWRVLPEAPFRVSYEQQDGSARRDVVSGVWTDNQLVVWSPNTDEIAAYLPITNEWIGLPPTGLTVDSGVLRWTGEDLYALGALTSSYPNPVPIEGVVLVGVDWMAIPPVGVRSGGVNIGAEPRLTGWASDRLVAFAHTEEGRAVAYLPAEDTWVEIPDVPLPGTDMEPIAIDDRLFVFGWGGGAIYDPTLNSWTVVGVRYSEAGRAVWTGEHILAWGDASLDWGENVEGSDIAAWRFKPPSSAP